LYELWGGSRPGFLPDSSLKILSFLEMGWSIYPVLGPLRSPSSLVYKTPPLLGRPREIGASHLIPLLSSPAYLLLLHRPFATLEDQAHDLKPAIPSSEPPITLSLRRPTPHFF